MGEQNNAGQLVAPLIRLRGRNLALIFVIATALLTAIVWFASYRFFVSEEMQRAHERLSLYRSTVLAEVDRFEHLTQVLSVDPFVIEALEATQSPQLNTRLQNATEAAGLDAIFLMRPDGETIAASNAGQLGSFVGESYDFRPYFQQALAGTSATFYGIGATTGQAGYFIADPVRDARGQVIGVVALKINLEPFEQSWREAGEQVFLVNEQGVVILASDLDWRYRSLSPLTAEQRTQIEQTRQFPGQALSPLDWTVDDANARAEINGQEWLHLLSPDLPHGWRLHYLAPDDRAVTRAWLAAGGIVVLSALALVFAQFQRGQRLRVALRRSEEEEEALRHANLALGREVEERRRAERRLEETREELDRASRLAALGQLSASVTHELGQPIAAMRNHLAAAEMTGRDQGLAHVISGLVERMAGITRQLKFFARSGGEAFEDVDMRDCVAAALDLMAPSIEADAVQVEYTAPSVPFTVRGSRLRIEQVLTNVLRNGVDAMDEADSPVLTIAFGQDETTLWVQVTDTGHGLGKATLSELQEPFVTTRASGEGMGLGLTISARILDDHGGRLEALNGDKGGAVFRMVLPRPEAREVAAQ